MFWPPKVLGKYELVHRANNFNASDSTAARTPVAALGWPGRAGRHFLALCDYGMQSAGFFGVRTIVGDVTR